MKKILKIMIEIHVSDWRMSLLSGALFSTSIVTIGAALVIVALYALSENDVANIVIAALLLLAGIACSVIWKRLIWDAFVHNLADLS